MKLGDCSELVYTSRPRGTGTVSWWVGVVCIDVYACVYVYVLSIDVSLMRGIYME
jgi:hypothetical protein